MDSILRAEVCYASTQYDSYGVGEPHVWYEGVLDLKEISSFLPYLDSDDVVSTEITEVTFKSGISRMIKVPYLSMVRIMTGIMGKPIYWDDLIQQVK